MFTHRTHRQLSCLTSAAPTQAGIWLWAGFLSSPGVQHVPGDSGGLHHAAQGRPAGLALCAAHSAAQEDGGRPAGLRPGQSPEGAGRHQVGSDRSIIFYTKSERILLIQLLKSLQSGDVVANSSVVRFVFFVFFISRKYQIRISHSDTDELDPCSVSLRLWCVSCSCAESPSRTSSSSTSWCDSSWIRRRRPTWRWRWPSCATSRLWPVRWTRPTSSTPARPASPSHASSPGPPSPRAPTSVR